MRLVSTNNLVGVGESQTLGATSNESDIEILTQPLNPYILPEQKECQQRSREHIHRSSTTATLGLEPTTTR